MSNSIAPFPYKMPYIDSIQPGYFSDVGYDFSGDVSLGNEVLAQRLNPIAFWIAKNDSDAVGFWGLDQIRLTMASTSSGNS